MNKVHGPPPPIPREITPEVLRAWKEGVVELTYEELAHLSPWHRRSWIKWIQGERRPNPALRVVMLDIQQKLGLS